MWELIKEFAVWVGWFPIAIGSAIVIILGKHFYEREISIRDQRIGYLKDEIETGKAYQYDEVYKRLTERLKTLNQELGIAKSESDTKQDKIKQIYGDLAIAYSEIYDLQAKLRKFDDQLGELLEPEYCEICDPEEDHSGANFIYWGTSMCEITGDENLVSQVGHCNYCISPQIKCGVCGSVTSINLESDERTECTGGCGVVFTIDSYVEDHLLQHSINVSRIESGPIE
jgi:hypothetical protein